MEWKEEDKAFAMKMIEDDSSESFIVRKLVEQRGMQEDDAKAMVFDLMIPVIGQKLQKAESNQAFLYGAAFLVIGSALLAIELMFLTKVHIILILAPLIGIYFIIKGIVLRVQKPSKEDYAKKVLLALSESNKEE